MTKESETSPNGGYLGLEKLLKARYWRAAGVAAIVAVLSLGAAPAYAGETTPAAPEDICAQAARDLAVAEGLDTSGGLSFACSPGRVDVSSSTTDEAVAGAVAFEAVDSRAFAATSFPDRPEDCFVDTDPYRWTQDELYGGVSACIFWGQQGDPVNGTWVEKGIVDLLLDLHSTTHWAKIYWHGQTMNPGYMTTTLSGYTQLKKENFGLPPTTIDTVPWDSPSYTPVDWFGLTGMSFSGGVYSVHLNGMRIVDTSRAFEIGITGPQVATWRFHCPAQDADDATCRWPGGQEAPLL